MLLCFDRRTDTGCMTMNSSTAQYCLQCGRSLRFALNFHDPGTRIANYQIVRLIGNGAFGAVYEAEALQGASGRVAIKETFDPDSLRSFMSEFAVLSRLHHDNLPQYYEVFEADGHGYLVMELVPGQSLEEILAAEQRPLREAQVLGYAVQLCDVLTYLHDQNPPILHRDIKPANIRLTPHGLIKLVDFGLLKQGTEQTRHTLRGIGTLVYAPFEQFGRGGTDPRSDIYSLGATLYHLLSAQEPLPVPERLAGSNDTLVPLRQHNPAISAHVAEAIHMALNLWQRDRHADMQAFKRMLLGIAPSPVPNPSTLPWPQSNAPTAAPPTAAPPQSSTLPWPKNTTTPRPNSPSNLPWPKNKDEG